MSVVQSVTEYFCPQCEVWSVAAAWKETERVCEDCGSHSALRCPACEESTDTVTMDLEEREKMTHAANDWDLCGACGGRRDAHIPGEALLAFVADYVRNRRIRMLEDASDAEVLGLGQDTMG